MVAILTAVLTDGLAAVEAAYGEAIGAGTHSADVILNVLARRNDPGAIAPVTTSASLALTLPPRADCARYDGLRPPPITAPAALIDSTKLAEASHGAV